jgi:NAD(P)-dependent dehydrogenase (short-subunit alcohol dehydrogenase family)
MTELTGQVALVTGASRGVGRGVALGLAHAGATVFATGRQIAEAELEPGVTAIVCDHTNDEAVSKAFQQIEETAGRLDILVNVAWGGYERMVEDGRFTWMLPFWEQPTWRSRGLCCEPTCGAHDGLSAARIDRSRLVVGRKEIRR